MRPRIGMEFSGGSRAPAAGAKADLRRKALFAVVGRRTVVVIVYYEEPVEIPADYSTQPATAVSADGSVTVIVFGARLIA